MKNEAPTLAEILIKLQFAHPLFFPDVAPDDPDLDMDRGFKTYEKLDRQQSCERE